MSTVTSASTDNYRMNVMPLPRSDEASTSFATSHDLDDLYLEADEIASRLAEIKSKWSSSERIVREMIGRARRDRLASTLLRCKCA